jgi:hypothetical protein
LKQLTFRAYEFFVFHEKTGREGPHPVPTSPMFYY